MERAKTWIIKQDESWFYLCNQWPALIVVFFKNMTHLGGARFTIGLQLLLYLFGPAEMKPFVILASLSLVVSHIIVMCIKKIVKRIRPYMALPQAKVHGYLFNDHSFPSGHSTAIFSIMIPYSMYDPYVASILLPVACLVAFSRVVLGVHYPTDILVGSLIGSLTAVVFSFWL
ncbi:phosphatase PAP2 family protein [Cytobacillus spongiae]|nr:phosphatase PAP2 family protein [Cytobacillus spongiae]UII55950.1 phosphatase PAP2 family protein [Cytobacillus spongiae]